MADTLKITILDDGTIKTETDAISMPNHQNAETFLRTVDKLAGGPVTVKHKTAGRLHTHQDGTVHQH